MTIEMGCILICIFMFILVSIDLKRTDDEIRELEKELHRKEKEDD